MADPESQRLVELLARFDAAWSALPPEFVQAETEHGLPRMVSVAVEGFLRMQDAPTLLAYARDAIIRSHMTKEEVENLLRPLWKDLTALSQDGAESVLVFASMLTLDGRIDGTAWSRAGVEYAVRHHVLALPACLHGCDEKTLRELVSHASPWVRWAALDLLTDRLLDPGAPCDPERALLDLLLDDPFEPVRRQARHTLEDRAINEELWRMRGRPRDEPDHAAARHRMRGHRSARPRTFEQFRLAFRLRSGAAAYDEQDLLRFLG